MTAFALTYPRLFYNARVAGSTVSGTYAAGVRTDGAGLSVGRTSLVHRPTAPYEVEASGGNVEYLLGNGVADVTRVVRTPHGSLTVRHTLGQNIFENLPESSSLSGNRLVYAVQEPGYHYRASSTSRRAAGRWCSGRSATACRRCSATTWPPSTRTGRCGGATWSAARRCRSPRRSRCR